MPRRTLLPLTLLLLLSAPLPAQAPPIDKFAAGVREEVLPNGLRVLIAVRRHAPTVCVELFYKVGAAHETAGKTGVAHFLEHLMFKRTQSHAPGEIDALTLVNAGDNNAETWDDFTHYWFDFPSDRWKTALAIEAERMLRFAVDDDDLKSERDVVLEELRGDLDSGFGPLRQRVSREAYGDHVYGRPVIGDRMDIEALTRADLLAFHKKHCAAGNAVLVIVGDVDPVDALAEVKKLFASAPKVDAPAEPAVFRVPARRERREFVMKGPDTWLRGVYLWHTVPMAHPDTPALTVLEKILGEGRTARFLEPLERDRDWNGEVAVTHESQRFGGRLEFAVTASGDYPRARIDDALRSEIRRLARKGPSERELEAARNRLLADFDFAQENTADLAFDLGRHAATADWRLWSRHIAAIRELTRDDIALAARTYLDEGRLTVGWSTPGKAAGEGEAANSEPAPSKGRGERRAGDPVPLKVPLPESTPSLTGYNPQRIVLPNGLVLIWHKRETPAVAVRALLQAGRLREAVPGAAHLTARLLRYGTQTRSSDQIADAVEAVGATLSVDVDGPLMKVRPADLNLALDLVADLLRRPKFDAEDFEDVLEFVAADLAGEADDDGTIATRLLAKHIYGDHPLGRPEFGTAPSLERMRRDDVLRHHKDWYTPDNTVLVVVGDFDPVALQAEVKRRFGDWQGKKATPPALPKLARRGGAVDVIPRPREQTLIEIGHLGVRRDDPDHSALLVLDHLFGAGPGLTDRLNRVLREQTGLAYSVSADISGSAGHEPGAFQVSLAVSPANRRRAVDAVLTEIRRLAEGDISPEEFRRARAFLLGHWVFSYETAEQLAERLAEMELYGLGLDHPTAHLKRLAALTLDDVKRAAAKHLSADACRVVVVGKE